MKLTRIVFAVLALALGSTGWGQSVFTKYGPVAGIQKSTGATYQNTAAAAADVTTLFGCTTPGQFLNQAGGCTVPAGTGVTSVSQTVPAGFAVTGSPVTSSGTLAISYATGQTANRVLATPDGTTGALSLRALVAGDIPPINLGSTANGGVSSATILLGTNGGTSNGFFSVTGPTTALRTFTFPNASATVLTTNAAVTVPQGGTGLATLTANGVMLGEGASSPNFVVMGADTVLRGTASADPVALAVNNCGSSTTALSYSTSTHTFGCQTITGAGGNPGGSTTQMQYNNSSVFGGTAGLTWDNVNNKLAFSVASAGSDYLSLTSTNTSFIGESFQVSTGHLFALRASSSGFFIADGTNGTNPISFSNTGHITFVAPTSGATPTLLMSGLAGTPVLQLNGPVTGSSATAYIAFADSAGTRSGYLGNPGTANITMESDGGNLNFIPITTTGVMQLSYDGGGTYQSMPRGAKQIIWGAVSANGSGCTILASGSLTGACTRTAQGNYSIGSTGATNNMGCTASPTFTPSNGARAAGISGATSSITVAIYNAAGTAVDDNFQFVCMTQ